MATKNYFVIYVIISFMINNVDQILRAMCPSSKRPSYKTCGECSNLQSFSACYGITLKNLIVAGCDEGEFIVIDSLYSYAKPVSDNCPETMMSSSTPDSCCQYKAGDCGALYSGVSKSQYYENCQSLNKCKATQVAWEPTPCNGTKYMSRTNYMVLNYYCIKNENNLLSAGTNATVSGATVLLQNEGYHLSSQQSSTITCLVETSCISNIQVLALDLQMDNTQSNTCPHEVKLSSDGNIKNLRCEDIDNVNTTTVMYTSNGPRLTLQLITQPSSSTFKYLFTFAGVHENATISVGCNLDRTSLTNKTIPACPSDQIETTTTTTTEAPTTTEQTTTTEALTTTAAVTTFTTTTNKTTAGPGVIKHGQEKTVTEEVVMLINSGHPFSSTHGASNYSCSAVASCNTGINVTSADFHLAKVGGSCSQAIQIVSVSGSNSYDCDDDRITFISSSPSIILNVISYKNNNEARFRILFTALDSAVIRLVCNNSEQHLLQSARPACSDQTTSKEEQQPMEEESAEAWKWVVPVVLVVVLIGIIFLCLLNRDRISRCCSQQAEDSDEEEITKEPQTFDEPRTIIKPNAVAPTAFTSVGPRTTRYPTEVFAAATATAKLNMKKKKHKMKKEKLYKKEKELKRRESELEIKENKIKEMQEQLSKREAQILLGVTNKWSSFSQSKVDHEAPQARAPILKFYENYKLKKASKYQPEPEPEPQPDTEEFTPDENTNITKIQKKVSLQSLATAVSVFTPKKSSTVCIDVSNEDGEFLNSTVYGSNC